MAGATRSSATSTRRSRRRSTATTSRSACRCPAPSEVDHVCTAVSASLDVFERAAAAGAQMLVVHHGLFWDGSPRRIGMLERRRLETLFRDDLSLVAYHLPLDGHARARQQRGARRAARPRGRARRSATTADACSAATGRSRRRSRRAALAHASARRSDRSRWCSPAAPTRCERVGVISGAAGREIGEAAELGLDCFVTGEPEEDSPYLAAELGVTLIAAGHNATETVGVRAVGERLARRVRRHHELPRGCEPCLITIWSRSLQASGPGGTVQHMESQGDRD